MFVGMNFCFLDATLVGVDGTTEVAQVKTFPYQRLPEVLIYNQMMFILIGEAIVKDRDVAIVYRQAKGFTLGFQPNEIGG